jgi:lysophospholipase L1-like esterase
MSDPAPPRDWHPRPFRKLVTLGESTTAGGWSSVRERSWPHVLAGLISDFQDEPVELVNTGIGANVISTRAPCYSYSGKPAANERVQKHVIDHDPDLLVISYGLNDARGGTPAEMFRTEMTAVIEQVRAGCDPLIVLPGPYYMTDFTVGGDPWSHADLDLFYRYNDATEQIAEACDCLFVNLLESYRDADWLVHHDGVHANDLGHRIVANKIFEVLASNCSGLALGTEELEAHIPPWRDESVLRGVKTKP